MTSHPTVHRDTDEELAFPDLLPYVEYEDDVFILSDGSLGKIWKLSPLECEARTLESLSGLAGQWDSLLSRLSDPRMAFQFILKSGRCLQGPLSCYQNACAPGQHAFVEQKTRHFSSRRPLFTHHGRPFLAKQITLFATARYFPEWPRRMGRRVSLDHQMADLRGKFLQHISMMENVFESASMKFEEVDDQNLGRWLYQVLNPQRSESLKPPVFHGQTPLRDQILFHPAFAEPTGFTLENQKMRVISLKELPLSTVPGLFTREFHDQGAFCALDIPQDFLLTVNFTVPGGDQTLSKLKMQKSLAFLHQENWLGDRAVEAVEKKRELDETIANLFKSGGKILHGRWHWVIFDDNEARLEQASHALIGGLNRLGCGALKEEIVGASIFLSCLPLNFDPYQERTVRRRRCLPTVNAADLLPIFGSFQGTPTLAQLYCNRRGELIGLDFFDSNTNPHGVVIGASGAGKSFFINDFILQNARLDAHFFVLDKGGSYEKLCQILNGRYLSFDFRSPVTINPFCNPPTAENLSFLVSLLSQMASGGDERDRLSREEEGLLQRALLTTFDQIPDREVVLSDFIAILNDAHFNSHHSVNERMGPSLALRLNAFTRQGPYGKFFDGPNQFHPDRSFTVFELATLGAYPDLQAAVLLNLIFYMTNFVGSQELRPKRKFLLIDEAWALLKVKNTTEFISGAFKTFRKYRCSVVAVTQEIADLTRQESGIAIIANASNKVFLKQEPALIELLKTTLSLPDHVLGPLKTLETVKGKFSEALVLTDATGGIIRLVPDPFLFWVANSDPRNNEYLAGQMKKAASAWEALALCSQEHPYGLP